MNNQQGNPSPFNEINRRKFISAAAKAAGASVFINSSFLAFAGGEDGSAEITVGEVMDAFINEVAGAPFSSTVDTLKAGSRDIKVTGIVTTMFATLEVIQKAIASGANFIIAHEPTFYNHADDTDWLMNDDVYRFKTALLKKHNIAIWRNHDYIHRHMPDGVMTGVLDQLGWSGNSRGDGIVILPAVSLSELIQHAKQKLGIDTLRYIGDLAQPCKKILLMPGAYGGRRHIEGIRKHQPDVLICGEIQEWETTEYVRDAQTKGQKLSLIILGHADSEEPGSAYMADWLRKKVPGLPVTHIPARNPLAFL